MGWSRDVGESLGRGIGILILQKKQQQCEKVTGDKNCQRGERVAEATSSTENLGSASERYLKELALDSSPNHSQHECRDTGDSEGWGGGQTTVEGVSLF